MVSEVEYGTLLVAGHKTGWKKLQTETGSTKNWSTGTSQWGLVKLGQSAENIWGVRVRNAGEKSVLIYRTLEILGGVFWPLIL